MELPAGPLAAAGALVVASVNAGAFLFAQAVQPTQDPTGGLITGGAVTFAGLLSAVLAWLLWAHLPAKDRQVAETAALHRQEIRELQTVFSENLRLEREASERRHREQMEAAERRHRETVEGSEKRHHEYRAVVEKQHGEDLQAFGELQKNDRDVVHAIQNLANTLRLRNQLADAFSSLHTAAWTKSVEGLITSWNESAEHLLGWREEDVRGKSIYDLLIPPNRRAEEQDVLRRVSAGEHVGEYQTERLTKDRRRVRLRVVTSPIVDPAGKVLGASTTARLADPGHDMG